MAISNPARWQLGVWVWAAVAASAPGCAAVKATQQPEKHDLTVLDPGTPRTHVIAELGAPTWSETRDGATTDVFAFRQGYSKGVRAGRAFVHGAADVLTFGLWEVVGIPAETLIDGTEVKAEVRYDPEQLVESVDVIEGEQAVHPRPWFDLKRNAAAENVASKARPANGAARR